jgi:hypothetical protein
MAAILHGTVVVILLVYLIRRGPVCPACKRRWALEKDWRDTGEQLVLVPQLAARVAVQVLRTSPVEKAYYGASD